MSLILLGVDMIRKFKKPKVEEQKANTILRKGKIQILKRPYTPEQVRKFVYGH